MSFLNIITYFSLIIITKQKDSLYKIPLDIVSQNYIPMIPIYIKEYPSISKLLSLDINLVESWIFNYNLDNSDDNRRNVITKRGFYFISGKKNKETIYLNSEIKIADFNYMEVNQINDGIYNSGSLSMNKILDSNNIISYFTFDDNNQIKYDKYFGFCLDLTNLKQNKPLLYIGNLKELNNDISKLTRFPIYAGDSEKDKEKMKSIWAIKLKGLFIGNVTKNINMDNGNNEVNHIDKTKNKGLIIDEPATIDTIFNYIYITKEAMLFLIANYFNDKREICEREGVQDEDTYEIKYKCLKNKKKKLNNINLILENNITIELTNEDLLNCAINKNMGSKISDDKDTCEFIIRYHNNIEHYSIGLPILRKFKTYFLYNDNSILFENKNAFSLNYLDEAQFSNISRQNKKTLGQTIKELFNTTLCITFIFVLLVGGFYLYDKYYDNNGYGEGAEKIININKYTNL